MAQPDDHEGEPYDEESPRSIFSALWFRALIVVLVLGVVAAIAVPYVLDVLSPPVPQPVVVAPPPKPAPAPTPAAPPPAASAPAQGASPTAAPAPAAEKPAAVDKPVAAGKPAAGDKPAQAAGPAADKPPAPAAKPPEPAASKPEVAKPDSRAPKAAAAKAAPRSEAPSKPAAQRPATAAKAEASSAPGAGKRAVAAGGPGEYFVQVGAFRDQAAARRVAARLREQNYNVVESVKAAPGGDTTSAAGAEAGPAASAGDRYDVFVSGASPAEISSRLTARGLAVDSVAGGVVVKPSLPLREAVSLSKDLAADGLKVQVRRAGGQGAAKVASAPAGVGETLYRVRVGGYPDRSAAQAAARELEAKGYRPFIARGGQ